MSINPVTTTENIRDEYTKYLKSMFLFKDKKLRESADKAIENSKRDLVKGPYFESTAMYKSGSTLQELVDTGKLHKEFERLIPTIGEFPLHLHQEEAIERSVVENKNMIVATGTGSGKTECFTIPILNYLVEQNSNSELTPGVRALILYPMNALANDQLKRLRVVLKDYPEITFGRYTGETKETQNEALDNFKKMNPGEALLPNELISREEMRLNPPHILLTNYAMLEYLLLRPDDNVFFDGIYNNHWRYIVLDEAHVYSGSLGSEVSYLIARLKDRIVNGEKGRINFIATSATLGGGDKELNDVVKYAEDLFGESFQKDCLITSERMETKPRENLIKPDLEVYKELLVLSNKYSGKELAVKINNKKIYEPIKLSENSFEVLYDALIQDAYVNKLKLVIENETLLIHQVLFEVFACSDLSNMDAFLAMVDLAAKAKKEDNSEVLLPARYHTFSRAIEGAFIQLYPTKKVYLNRKEHEIIGKEEISVFELANCQKCGQEYLIGKIRDGYLKQSSGFLSYDNNERMEHFLLKEGYSEIELDEDSIVDDGYNDIEIDNTIEYLLCIKCGKTYLKNKKIKNTCCFRPKLIKIYKVNSKGVVNTCLDCGSRGRPIVKRLVNADTPTTEMLGRTLYQNIPPKETKDIDETEKTEDLSSQEESLFNPVSLFNIPKSELIQEENGRKLLAFSDSRREAAYFASYMDIRYNIYLWRKIIYDAIISLEDNEITFKKLHTKIYKDIEGQKDLLVDSSEEIDETISAYLMYELMSYERTSGIEGVGLVSFEIPKPDWWPSYLELCGLKSDEVWDIIEQIFQGIRTYRGLDFPMDLRSNHSIFGQRTKQMYFRYADADSKAREGIMSIRPKENYSNMRFDYLVKIFIKRGHTEEDAKKQAEIFLERTFNDTNFIDGFKGSGIYIARTIPGKGELYKINHNKWLFKTNKELFRCNKCGKKSTVNIESVCSAYRCDGNLEAFLAEESRHTYYADIYNNIKRIPMKIKEHTAQLSSQHASEIQGDFEGGKVNILSCSTTFEMGVDVGSLEAVFLRNIPPETSNYVQRAGRAGRRTASTAYILTYAKRRSHDLHFFQNPEKIIEGQIKAPYIEKNNDKIAFRHLCSIVFSWLFRKHVEYFDKVKGLFAYQADYPSVDYKLKDELSRYPEEIKNSIENIFSEEMQSLFEVADWGWVEKHLLSEVGNLKLSKVKWEKDIEEIMKIRKENYEEGGSVDIINRMLKTFLDRTVIDFLASNNVLPRYGFPIDTVSLDTLHIGMASNNVNLSRDLKMAISEFAPGNKVIANGYMWESYAVNTYRTKGWPTFLYGICKNCHNIYKDACDYNLKISEIDEEKKSCQKCGSAIIPRKFIKPIFGFSTNNSEPEKATLAQPNTSYSSKVYFHQYDENERNYESYVKYHTYKIPYTYSPRGNLFIVNQGNNNTGFRICSRCGHGVNDILKGKYSHKDRYGNPCGNEYLNSIDLGHEIITDIIEIKIPNITAYDGMDFYLSTLYALIEGAVGYIGIDRREIDGCLNYTIGSSTPSFILYDQVPGGAGHVKRIAMELDKVIVEAKKRVNGLCECGEETSCYGCLRNYTNQTYHDILSRGDALEFIRGLEK